MSAINNTIENHSIQLPEIVDEVKSFPHHGDSYTFTAISPGVWLVYIASHPEYRGTLLRRGDVFDYTAKDIVNGTYHFHLRGTSLQEILGFI
ncbi:hypothetical protein [Lysinibacter sp. HNR]|uniref:hypothetical protein n=1 Tax=Lysinibacter sp. HNR TaxID=3031408 RepID=UPI00243584BC|nr:hypothetical protein [Lysinibacter sp. HNR]WGD36577.1 hypothetical protein FrondiHNR_08875 [Lysinibacter sp. HNR]